VENGDLLTALPRPRTTHLKHAVRLRTVKSFCTSQSCNFAQNVITRPPYYSNLAVGQLFLKGAEKMVCPIIAPNFKRKPNNRDSKGSK
jgi:hypothetical protein